MARLNPKCSLCLAKAQGGGIVLPENPDAHVRRLGGGSGGGVGSRSRKGYPSLQLAADRVSDTVRLAAEALLRKETREEARARVAEWRRRKKAGEDTSRRKPRSEASGQHSDRPADDNESRFDRYGQHPERQQHVTEYENDDLTSAELWQKVEALEEGHEYDAARQALRDLAKRPNSKPKRDKGTGRPDAFDGEGRPLWYPTPQARARQTRDANRETRARAQRLYDMDAGELVSAVAALRSVGGSEAESLARRMKNADGRLSTADRLTLVHALRRSGEEELAQKVKNSDAGQDALAEQEDRRRALSETSALLRTYGVASAAEYRRWQDQLEALHPSERPQALREAKRLAGDKRPQLHHLRDVLRRYEQ